MKKGRYTEAEIIKAVNEFEKGVSADSVCRTYNISRATLSSWRSKYAGLEVNQLKELKSLQEENRRLKQMYADLALDNKILRDVIEKNSNARGKKRNCNGDCRRTQCKHISGM